MTDTSIIINQHKRQRYLLRSRIADIYIYSIRYDMWKILTIFQPKDREDKKKRRKKKKKDYKLVVEVLVAINLINFEVRIKIFLVVLL